MRDVTGHAAGIGGLEISAINGTLTPPMQRDGDYISVPKLHNRNYKVSSGPGRADFIIVCGSGTKVRLQGELEGPNSGSNSFYVWFDNGTPSVWNVH